MMAAGRAAESGAEVLLLEKTERPGKKLLISGRRRCNLTNARELNDFIDMYGPNGRFLRSVFHRYFRDDLLAFLRRYGVDTRTEQDGRVFPASNSARDVVRAFEMYMADDRVELQSGVRVTSIQVERGRVVGVHTEQGACPAKAVVLATGGASFPGTGSSGDGYRMAAAVGHTINKLSPALVPLAVYEVERASSMQGVSLHDVRLTAYQCPANEIDPLMTPNSDSGRGHKPAHFPVIESRRGDMMLTHFGIGGPITLRMSLAIVDALEHGPVSVSIDLKPQLGHRQLSQQLQEEFNHHSKRGYRNILQGLLPRKMVDPFVEMTGILPHKLGHQITAEERERVRDLLKSLRFNIKGPLPLTVAMVTAGGVSLSEIDPRTMASRLITGLYFCGEVMDIDGDTDGYNLQAAFSTGYVAGEQAALLATAIPDN
jgi:predicted flavoprotein YhiN